MIARLLLRTNKQVQGAPIKQEETLLVYLPNHPALFEYEVTGIEWMPLTLGENPTTEKPYPMDR